jgi:hypothetical protein
MTGYIPNRPNLQTFVTNNNNAARFHAGGIHTTLRQRERLRAVTQPPIHVSRQSYSRYSSTVSSFYSSTHAPSSSPTNCLDDLDDFDDDSAPASSTTRNSPISLGPYIPYKPGYVERFINFIINNW